MDCGRFGAAWPDPSRCFMRRMHGTQVAAVNGFGVAIAIFSTVSISGAHLNPAVTIAFALFRSRVFPRRRAVR